MVKTVESTLLLGLLLAHGCESFNFFSGIRVAKPYALKSSNGLRMVISLEPSTSSRLLSEDPEGSSPSTFLSPPESEATLTFDPVSRLPFVGRNRSIGFVQRF